MCSRTRENDKKQSGTSIVGHPVHIFVFEHNIFRLKGLNYTPDEDPQPRKRSNSLPVPKIEVTSHEMIKMDFKEKLPNIEESCGEALLGGSSDR